MIVELVINKTDDTTMCALLENGKLYQVIAEEFEDQIAGNIYLGKIEKIVSALDAAFVKLPEGQNGFLRLRDVKKEYLEKFVNQKKLTEGQKILVQVKKEGIGKKGPQVTTNIAVVGKLLVLFPFSDTIGISKKITDENERVRLKQVAINIRNKIGHGCIIRTAAERIEEEDIYKETLVLQKVWNEITQTFKRSRKEKLLYKEVDRDEYIVREYVTKEVNQVYTNDSKYRELIRKAFPKRSIKIEVVEGDSFEIFGIYDKINEINKRRIQLTSGGEIVIDRAEAMTVIDVNSAHYTNSSSHSKLSFEINKEAAKEIARQIMLRNLSGIIIVDFIDMDTEENRKRIVEILEDELSKDKNKVTIHGFTKLGLLELTRKRTTKPLVERFQTTCPTCGGSGTIIHPNEILRKIAEELSNQPENVSEVIIRVHPHLKNFITKETLANLKKHDFEIHLHYTYVTPTSYELTWKLKSKGE